jgi:hypothetical protein
MNEKNVNPKSSNTLHSSFIQPKSTSTISRSPKEETSLLKFSHLITKATSEFDYPSDHEEQIAKY